jgi:HAE1 family hydrophobic/amphiphilic exporter-1
LLVAVYSPHGTYNANFLANYAYINLADPVLRSPGIGNVQVFGSDQYAMRLWVNPDTLPKPGITVPDIITAIQAQNTVNPAGKAGASLLLKARSLPTRFWRRVASYLRKNSAT